MYCYESEKCRNCAYRVKVSGTVEGSKGKPGKKQIACQYILIRHTSRGCPVGDECDKFIKSRKTFKEVERFVPFGKGLKKHG